MFCFLIGYQMQGMVISAGISVSNIFAWALKCTVDHVHVHSVNISKRTYNTTLMFFGQTRERQRGPRRLLYFRGNCSCPVTCHYCTSIGYR